MEAAGACGPWAIFVIDNLGLVNRGRAILASLQGATAEIPALVLAAEHMEMLAEQPDHSETIDDVTPPEPQEGDDPPSGPHRY